MKKQVNSIVEDNIKNAIIEEKDGNVVLDHATFNLNKLKKEYREKIEICDKRLEICDKRLEMLIKEKRKYRHENNNDRAQEISTEIRISNIQRQIYVQILHDLEDI